VFALLAADADFRRDPHGGEFLELLARQIGALHRDSEVAAVLKAIDALSPDESAFGQSIVRGLIQGLAKGGASSALIKGSPRANELLRQMLDTARQTAQDEARTPRERIEAVR
jgi:hypothetical protein